MKRGASLLAILVLVSSLGLGSVAITATAAGGNATATSTASPTPTATPTATETPESTATATPKEATPDAGSGSAAEFDLEDLREGGTRPAGAPPSVRLLGETGAVAIEHTPPSLTGSERKFLKPSARVEADKLRFRSTRFGRSIEERAIVVRMAFYEVETRAGANGTKRKVPANIKTHSVRVNMGTGYDAATIELPSHYDGGKLATMWLEEPDGDRIEGARWTFKHHSNPATRSPANPINSRGDLWGWAAVNILLVAVPGTVVSSLGARRILAQVGAPPGYPPAMYAIAAVFGGGALASAAYFEAAALLAHAPVLLGAVVAIVAFFAVLESEDSTEWFLFTKNVLEDAKTASGEVTQDAVYKVEREVRATRREDGTIGLIKTGLIPCAARFFADPARLDVSDLKTKVELEGKWAAEFVVDPFSDLDPREMWTPARFRTNWNLIGGILIASVVVGSGAAQLLEVSEATLGVPALGVLVALLVGVEALDGEVHYEPAPVHGRRALETLAHAQEEYEAADELESARRQVWAERTAKRKDVERRVEEYDTTLVEELLGEDVDPSVGSEEESRRFDADALEDGEGENGTVTFGEGDDE